MPVETTPTKPLSEVGRLLGVFTQPGRAFADIVARPRWFVPVILISLASLCLIFLFSQHVGFERLIEQSLEHSSRAQSMTPEQRAQALKTGASIGGIFAYVISVIMPTISVLVTGAVLMFMANAMFGAQITYGEMCAIAAYSYLTGLVSIALSIVIMFIKSPEDFDLRNPLSFNVGFYLNPDTTPKWLVSLGTSLDLFSFWTMALLAIGIAAGSRKKLPWTRALTAVVIPWACFVLVKSGWAAIFG
jgi:hypothetical protein